MSAENTVETQPTDPQTPNSEQAAPEAPEKVEAQEASTEPNAEGEQAEQQDGQKTRDEKGRFKGVQPRIDELTRARREAEREAAYWRGLAQQQAQPQVADTKPTPEQFENYADYVEALTDWKTEQKLNERLAQDANRKVAQTRDQTFQERVAETRKAIPDYDDVVSAADVPVAHHVAEAVKESDLGPRLIYHFARNPDELQRLNTLSPTQAAREIGRLEAQFADKPAPADPQPRLTQAPKPPAPIGQQGRSATLDPSKMSMEEYRQHRQKQGATWAR